MNSKNKKKLGNSSSINWAKWHQTRIISLAEAIFLALGRDPTGLDFYSNPLEPFPDRDPYWGFKNPAKHWFSIAMSSLDRPGGLESTHLNNQNLSNRIPYVDIRKFGKWIKKQGLSNVPNELCKDSEEVHTADGAVTYSFP